MTYNGWHNKETWLFNLWLGDDDFINHLVKQFSHKPYELEKQLKSYIEDLNPLQSASGLFQDLIQSSIDSINFSELASIYIEDFNRQD